MTEIYRTVIVQMALIFMAQDLIFKDKCFSKNMKRIKTARIAQKHHPKLFGTKNDNLQLALFFENPSAKKGSIDDIN